MQKFDSVIRNSEFFANFVSLKYLPRWVVLLIDISLSIAAFVVAVEIAGRISHTSYSNEWIGNVFRLSLFIILQVIFFRAFHTYSGVLRYSSFVDAQKILMAITANVLIVTFVNLVYHTFTYTKLYTYSELLIYSILAFVFLFLIRLTVKTFYDFVTQRSDSITPVMIYEIGRASCRERV